MASLRRQILLQLRERLQTLLPTWDVQLEGASHGEDSRVRATVFYTSESKELANNLFYSSRLMVGVYVEGFVEDADTDPGPAGDEGLALLYAERLVSDLEATVHQPDAWGVHPDFTDVLVTGHDLIDPDDSTMVGVVALLEFTFRHDILDPGA